MNVVSELFVVMCITLNFSTVLSYVIPMPKLEILSPSGFKLSIPAENEIVLVAFHGSINRPVNGIQEGDFNGEINKPTNGRFEYVNMEEVVEPNDILYFWMHVQHGNVAYKKINQAFQIKPNLELTYIDSSNFAEVTNPVKNRPTQQSNIVYTPEPTVAPVTQPPASDPINFENDFNSLICDGKGYSKTTVNGISACAGKMIFEENFNSIDLSKWEPVVEIPSDTHDAEFVSFQNREENLYVKDGFLHVVPTLLSSVPGFSDLRIKTGELDLNGIIEPEIDERFGDTEINFKHVRCTGVYNIDVQCKRLAFTYHILPPVVSAKIRTKNSFSFMFGRVEVRAKMPKGDWLFPLLTLEPTSNEYGFKGYASGQLRVAFSRGNEILYDKNGYDISGKVLYGGANIAQGANNRNWLRSTVLPKHLGDDFHTYELVWTDQRIKLSVDGKEYAEISGNFNDIIRTHDIKHAVFWSKGARIAPFDKEFHLSIGVSAGGISDFPPNCTTGVDRKEMPWENEAPKAELQFYKDKSNWFSTWNGEKSGLTVDYIRVYSLD